AGQLPSPGPRNELRAVIWTRDGIQDLGSLFTLRPRTYVVAMAQSGQVVVGSSGTDLTIGQTHAILWEHGVLQDLGTLPGYRASGASAMNARGDVVGWSSTSSSPTADVMKPVLWRRARPA